MTRLMLTTLIAAGSLLAPQVAAGPARAQEAPVAPQDAPEVTPEASPEVTEDLLAAFVTAAVEVALVAETYGARIEAAEDADRGALAEAAQAEMRRAVEDTEGISVEQYVAIAEAAQRDEALNQRILDEYRAQADEG